MASSKPKFDVTDDPGKFDEAIAWFEQKVPLAKDEFDSLLEADKEFAFTVANVTQADLVEEVFEELKTAIREGKSLDEFKEAVTTKLEDEWGSPDGGRVETIFRTNTNAAYNAGKYAVYTAPAVKAARPFWRYEGIDDDREDEECAQANDVILPADDPFWDTFYPPIHPNCRCTVTALDEEEAAEEGVDDEAPDAEAADGFGRAPSAEGSDWEPDPGDYSEEISGELADRLNGG